MASGLIHVGGWTGIDLLDESRRVLVFEPQARPFAELQQNLGGRENVLLVNAAAGANAGEAIMYTVQPDHSSSLFEPRALAAGFERAGTETVPMTTVDATIKGFDLNGAFDELVIDTQGYELEVLKGARITLARDIKRVELELHDPNTYPGAAPLEELDYFMTMLEFTRTALEWRDADLADHAFYEKR